MPGHAVKGVHVPALGVFKKHFRGVRIERHRLPAGSGIADKEHQLRGAVMPRRNLRRFDEGVGSRRRRGRKDHVATEELAPRVAREKVQVPALQLFHRLPFRRVRQHPGRQRRPILSRFRRRKGARLR